MNPEPDQEQNSLNSQLEAIKSDIWTIARQYEEDLDGLLSVLRTLELLHRDIREQMFEPSLPDNRQNLYHLLREIEERGGWPYIERMRLQQLLKKLSPPTPN